MSSIFMIFYVFIAVFKGFAMQEKAFFYVV